MLYIYLRKGEKNPIPINLYIYISKRPKRLWNYWCSQPISTQYEAIFFESTWRTQNN